MDKSTGAFRSRARSRLRSIARSVVTRLRSLHCYLTYDESDRDLALARLWDRAGEPDRAIAIYRRLLRSSEASAIARHAAIDRHAAAQQWTELLWVYLIDLDPARVTPADGDRSEVAERLQLVRHAIDWARAATPDRAEPALNFLGLALSLQQFGECDAAFAALLCAIAQTPTGNWDKKAFTLFRLCEQNRNNPAFLWNARLHSFLHTLSAAQPDCLRRRINYADVSWRVGRCGLARQLYAEIASQQLKQRSPALAIDGPTIAVPPSFAIVGAMKSGSTSLYAYLQQHPQVLPLARKEIDYWSWRYHRGCKWFLSHFPSVPATWQGVAGDASPTYFQHALAPQRMLAANPDFKAIVVLRDPVDRTISHHFHQERRASDLRELDTAIAGQIAAIEAGDYDPQRLDNAVASSLYAPHVQRWLAHFGRDRFLIILSDELFAAPQRVLSRVFAFLDIDDRQIPDVTARNVGHYDRDRQRAIRQRLRDFFAPSVRELEALCEIETPWR